LHAAHKELQERRQQGVVCFGSEYFDFTLYREKKLMFAGYGRTLLRLCMFFHSVCGMVRLYDNRYLWNDSLVVLKMASAQPLKVLSYYPPGKQMACVCAIFSSCFNTEITAKREQRRLRSLAPFYSSEQRYFDMVSTSKESQ
jgi:hypothetical protein